MPAYSPCVKGNPVVFRTSPQCDVYITDVALCGMGVGRCISALTGAPSWQDRWSLEPAGSWGSRWRGASPLAGSEPTPLQLAVGERRDAQAHDLPADVELNLEVVVHHHLQTACMQPSLFFAKAASCRVGWQNLLNRCYRCAIG